MTITSIKYQHASILKLARAGSTKFALSEYRRQGLDKIRDHEDIMALHVRLYKGKLSGRYGSDAHKNAF